MGKINWWEMFLIDNAGLLSVRTYLRPYMWRTSVIIPDIIIYPVILMLNKQTKRKTDEQVEHHHWEKEKKGSCIKPKKAQ